MSLARFREPASAKLLSEEREYWRQQFADAIIALAESSETLNDFYRRFADARKVAGLAPFDPMQDNLGHGAHRAAFAIPFQLVLKEEMSARVLPLEGTHNHRELVATTLLPELVPRVYGHCYRPVAAVPMQSINVLVATRIIPVSEAVRTVMDDSNPVGNLGVDPDTGRFVLLDTGGELKSPEKLLDGTREIFTKLPFLARLRQAASKEAA